MNSLRSLLWSHWFQAMAGHWIWTQDRLNISPDVVGWLYSLSPKAKNKAVNQRLPKGRTLSCPNFPSFGEQSSEQPNTQSAKTALGADRQGGFSCKWPKIKACRRSKNSPFLNTKRPRPLQVRVWPRRHTQGWFTFVSDETGNQPRNEIQISLPC